MATEPGASAGAPLPWMNAALSADQRANMVLAQMTADEKLSMVHGIMAIPVGPAGKIPAQAEIGAGYFPGIARLAIPALQETDGAVGIAYLMGMRKDGATAMPATLATAAGWDKQLAYDGGAMIGREAWSKGFNVLLAGGVNLTREPRNGRNFEYLSEDPLLSGVLGGEQIRGIQDQKVLATVKHFAFNHQETGRKILDVKITDAEARETELLAFQIAIERGKPGSVLCSYNKVNGSYACENDALLNDVLKKDWAYPGWVMSDWGAVHSTAAALKGLDQQSGEQLDDKIHFGDPLRQAAASDTAYATRLDDMVRRILRSMFAVGLFDRPPVKGASDKAANEAVAQKVAEQGITLLTNPRNILPLAKSAKSIAIIGAHADIAVLSGGGSSQVAPDKGPAITIPLGAATPMEAFWHTAMYMPSSPLKAIKDKAPDALISYDDGSYPSSAAALAKRSDIVILFADKWMGESYDAADLSLPNGQDALIAAVAAANPNTIVVLETGGPVMMPWLKDVGAVVEAWYPGAKGGEAIANILFGDVNPSGHLPMTFPAAMDAMPNAKLFGQDLPKGTAFDVRYEEGKDVGYRWYARHGVKPLFPFGYGLSYTSFRFGNVKVKATGQAPVVTFTVTNDGKRAGSAVPQLYLTDRPGGADQRLLGWERVDLAPGQSKTVSVTIEPRILANWDESCHCWHIPAGRYGVAISASAADAGVGATMVMKDSKRRP
ncbi:glycoside hydrolase family 3 C-terminal domain-containing protein [Sphingobium sp.]|uniref:beta-glucosidase family protein n=1 Tax=Sphingobium sp. TaxID=1912891 RepID=UPI00261D9EFB|nr:glycoside hydrolase family 3 C-terminal domain-containing protein [Sphingobium sp.]